MVLATVEEFSVHLTEGLSIDVSTRIILRPNVEFFDKLGAVLFMKHLNSLVGRLPGELHLGSVSRQ